MTERREINIGIADDHAIVRQGIINLLHTVPDIHVILEAENGCELLDKLHNSETRPDIMLMDIDMPQMDGYTATKKISTWFPGVKVMALTMHYSNHAIYHMLQAGAVGFLPKGIDLEKLKEAIYRAYEHGYFYDDKTIRVLEKGFRNKKKMSDTLIRLTDQETKIIKLICSQKTNKEIADELCLSIRTVEGIKDKIHDKTNTKNSAGLVLYALSHDIIDHLF